MLYLLLYLFGLLPSLVWLAFYLRKDKHPEPNRMIIKVFLFGMASAFLGVFLQSLLSVAVESIIASATIALTINIFLGAGVIEEGVKYFAAKAGAFYNKELDEPCDVMLYLIIAALGFAAVENVFYLNEQVLKSSQLLELISFHPLAPARLALEFVGWRFISATFLHALCSGLFGYFLALSFFYVKKRRLWMLGGLLLAATFHGLYDWFIMQWPSPWNFYGPLAILIFLSCFVSYAFQKLKTISSTCQP